VASGKNDRNFADGEIFFVSPVFHFYLKGISVGANFIQIQAFQNFSPIAFESARHIGERDTGDKSRIAIREKAHGKPPNRPIGDADSVLIAAPDNQIMAACGFQKFWYRSEIMREIGIHFENVFGAPVERVAKAGEIGRSQPHFARTAQEMNAIVGPL